MLQEETEYIENVLNIFDEQDRIILENEQKHKDYLKDIKVKFDILIQTHIISNTEINLEDKIIKEIYESRLYPKAYFKNVWLLFIKPHIINAIKYDATIVIKNLIELGTCNDFSIDDEKFPLYIKSRKMAEIILDCEEIKTSFKEYLNKYSNLLNWNINFEILFTIVKKLHIDFKLDRFFIIFVKAAGDDNMEIFLQYKTLLDKSFYTHILRLITGNCDIKYIKILLEDGADPNYEYDEIGNDIGNIIFSAKTLDELKLFKEYGCKFNSIHACGKSALESLIGKTNIFGFPFDYNSKINKYKMVEYYLNNGGIFDDTYNKNFYMIITSCRKLFHLLLEHGLLSNFLINEVDKDLLSYLILDNDSPNDKNYYINVLLRTGYKISIFKLNSLNGNNNEEIINFVKKYLYPSFCITPE